MRCRICQFTSVFKSFSFSQSCSALKYSRLIREQHWNQKKLAENALIRFSSADVQLVSEERSIGSMEGTQFKWTVDRVFRDCQNLPDIDYCNRSSICCSSDPILQASPTLLRIAEANIAGRYLIDRVSLAVATRVPPSHSATIHNNGNNNNNFFERSSFLTTYK